MITNHLAGEFSECWDIYVNTLNSKIYIKKKILLLINILMQFSKPNKNSLKIEFFLQYLLLFIYLNLSHWNWTEGVAYIIYPWFELTIIL